MFKTLRSPPWEEKKNLEHVWNSPPPEEKNLADLLHASLHQLISSYSEDQSQISIREERGDGFGFTGLAGDGFGFMGLVADFV